MAGDATLPSAITEHKQTMEKQAQGVADSLGGYTDKALAEMYVKYTVNEVSYGVHSEPGSSEEDRTPIIEWKDGLIGIFGQRTVYEGIEKAVAARFDTAEKAQSFVAEVMTYASENAKEPQYALGQLITDAARFNQLELLTAALAKADQVKGKLAGEY